MRFRILHFFYKNGAAIRHWLTMRIRPPGLALLLIATLAGFLCIGQPRNSVFQIFCLSIVLLSISMLWAVFRRAKIQADLNFSKHAHAGHPLTITAHVSNLTQRTLRSLILCHPLPDPRPTHHEFASQPEPGESERNPFDRTMAFYRWQWITNRNRLFESSSASQIFSLKSAESLPVTLTIHPLKRGLYPLHNLRLLLPDPLGFFQKIRQVPTKTSQLLVLPKIHPVPNLLSKTASNLLIGPTDPTNTIGTSGDFIGLRDYRPGDPLRLMHWKSWAHTGRPVVKELEDTHLPQITIYLETSANPHNRLIFEEMVSVTASITQAFINAGTPIQLLHETTKVESITTDPSQQNSDEILRALAKIQPVTTADLSRITSHFVALRKSLHHCILILDGTRNHHQNLTKTLTSSAIPHTPILVGIGLRPEKTPGHWLNTEHIAQDLLRLSLHLSAAPLNK